MKKPQTPILFLLVSFPTISALFATPSFPDMAQALGVSPAQVQATVTFFLLGYAFGNIPYGPLSKRYGRKPIIYLGAVLACLGALLISFSSSLTWVYLGRFCMGLGSGVGLKMTYTIIGDVYEHRTAAKIISILMHAFALLPAIGMSLGGYLTQSFGWQSCYLFLAGYSLFILGLCSFLPETSQEKDAEALNLKKIYEVYRRKFRNRVLLACGLIMGSATSIPYLFASGAPFIGITQIGLQPRTFGLLSWIPPVGIIGGSFLSHLLSEKKHPFTLMKIGLSSGLIASFLMLGAFLFEWVSPLTLFLPAPFIYAGFSMAFSQASALGISHAQDKSNASAMLHFLNMGSAMLSLLLSQALPWHTSWVLPGMLIASLLLMVTLRHKLTKLLPATFQREKRE